MKVSRTGSGGDIKLMMPNCLIAGWTGGPIALVICALRGELAAIVVLFVFDNGEY
jgi:Flp pilus assembly protein protease CpaA